MIFKSLKPYKNNKKVLKNNYLLDKFMKFMIFKERKYRKYTVISL